MTQVPCGGECIQNSTGYSCSVPIPSGPPPAPLPDDPYAPGCKCDVKAWNREFETIVEEENAENDALLPKIATTSGGLFILEKILEEYGPEILEPWIMGLDIPFLLNDVREIEEHDQEALEKIRQLDEKWNANCH